MEQTVRDGWNDYSVTPAKQDEAVRRIVAHADPLKVILFGSRARGTHRPDSDLDLAVILDAPQAEVHKRLPFTVLSGLDMEVTLIVVSKQKFDEHRPWLNSVFRAIDQEGVTLYDRNDTQCSRPNTVRDGLGRSVDSAISAA